MAQSPLSERRGGRQRRRQAAAVQGASRIFIDDGKPEVHEHLAL